MDWKRWAQTALDMMDDQGVEDESARAALTQILESGAEPYYTLKTFVSGLYAARKNAQKS